jgi:hypothetical protein
MTTFKRGQSGNPAGRPKGVKDRRTALREKLQPHADELIETVVRYAKAGDMIAMRLVVDRLVPPLKEEPIRVTIPKIKNADDCLKAAAVVVQAVATGDMLPSEGQAMAALIDAHRKAYETHDLAKRLEALEQALNRKGAPA